MFYAFVIGGQISGGQGNPIITIALIFTRGSNVTILNSLVYFISQCVGAIAGGAIGKIYFYLGYWTIDHKYGAPIPIPINNYPLAFGR
jgi:glycerol uptake facilitator-like aquaporin